MDRGAPVARIAETEVKLDGGKFTLEFKGQLSGFALLDSSYKEKVRPKDQLEAETKEKQQVLNGQ